MYLGGAKRPNIFLLKNSFFKPISLTLVRQKKNSPDVFLWEYYLFCHCPIFYVICWRERKTGVNIIYVLEKTRFISHN